MKCAKCGKQFDELFYLTEYGNNKLGNKNSKGYCEEDFDKKFSRLHIRKNYEESDD